MESLCPLLKEPQQPQQVQLFKTVFEDLVLGLTLCVTLLVASTSAELLNAPFQCCVLPNFVSASPSTGSGCSDGVDASSAMDSGITGLGACPSRTAAPSNGVDSGAGHNERPEAKATSSGDIFLKDLVLELLKLKFYEKNNDLYQFHQVSA